MLCVFSKLFCFFALGVFKVKIYVKDYSAQYAHSVTGQVTVHLFIWFAKFTYIYYETT